ncbi:uncharacterized protein BCR38DRAFT_58040 [Pseudomassariella vexata]|uniref:Uncharacterized protein n=1 Tax=Pseudomassariella vexata TaxID=1141098 RepID=A0A1Y2DK13_9PEZI|nr:uncharacterized protein BCR38DRAFT_58040 [Pseudomassariella vexata]ORY59484.1 hypothetical protein BCR38DRAFT_58040 [Pseudomassariella vexata]
MEGQTEPFHLQEGETVNNEHTSPLTQNPPAETGVKFANSFDSEGSTRVPGSETDAVHPPRVRTGSRDYSATEEWDASKVPPSRFQKRKGSIYSTPPSRDGHVQKNRDADAEFHQKHAKKFLGKAKDKVVGAVEGHKRKGSKDSQGSV